WVFAHNGDLDAFDIDEGIETVLPLSSTVIVPVGRTDSERAFCWLLEQCAAVKAYSLADVGWEQLHAWFRYLDDLGTANLMLTDGRDLVVYGDNNGYNRLHHGRLLPPDVPELLRTDDVDIGLTDARDRTRTAIIFSTSPPEETKLKPMHDGQLIVVRRGAYIFDSHATANDLRLMVPPLPAVDAGSPRTARPDQTPTGLQAAAHGDDASRERAQVDIDGRSINPAPSVGDAPSNGASNGSESNAGTPMTVEGMQKQTMNDGMQAQTLPVEHSPAPTVSQPSPSSRPTDAPITAGNGTADASTPTTEPLAQTTEGADRTAEGIESTNDDASAPRTEEAPANATLDER
ncbi:MAG: class II glutamine amidotransferase, partial [Myxococcota bacterium]